jgi:PAS domain S-box-containing protein
METLLESSRRSTDNILQFDDLYQQKILLNNSRRSFGRNIISRVLQAEKSIRRFNMDNLPDKDRESFNNYNARLESIRKSSIKYDNNLELLITSIDPKSGLPADQEISNSFRQKGRLLAREIRQLKRILKNTVTNKMLLSEKEESSTIVGILWLSTIAIVVGIFVTVLSLLVLRPIRQLAEGARRISRGDFSYTVEISSQDEFGLLAQEFNQMARSIANRDEEAARNQEKLEQANRQQRQASIDLELMKLYNENIIRSIHNGILVTDSMGTITTINPTAEKLWGLDPEQTIGQSLNNLPIAQPLSELTSNWEKVLLHRERMLLESLEFPSTSNNHRTDHILVNLYVSPLLGHDDVVQGVLLVGEDVTEKVRTEQALIQSERFATIGRMSAMVAHEIRNPLSSIGLNTELLEEEITERIKDTNGEPLELLHSISREVERLTEVTEEYLKFARLPKPNLLNENINKILENLLQFIEGEFKEANIEIISNFESQLSRIPADARQLRQALLNLIRNSAESMPNGGTLTITTEQSESRVVLQLEDTGAGISQESIDRIFEPFFSTREGGTGLGLALTHQIVSDHGGSIVCSSTVGKGTCFTIELPVS